MKIEKLGVKITDTPWPITVTPPVEIGGEMRGIRFADQDWTREATEQVRDALTVALAEYDTLTAATEQPAPSAPAFTVGQVLTGDEDLPVGTVVQDSDRNGADTWTFEGDQWVTPDGDSMSAQHWPGAVHRYGPVKIVSLP